MEKLHNGFTLSLCERAFPLSTDSIALSGFVKLPKNAKVLDLGSGCGTLGLLLCAEYPDCTVTGIELTENAHLTALQNAEQNCIAHRLTSICMDLKTIPSFLSPGSYQVCVSNPPYYTGGFKNDAMKLARHTDACTLSDLFESAAWALKYGGDFFLVHKPEQLAAICHHASANKLEPKRLLLLRHRENSPISLVLLQCRKGAKPGLTIEEAALYRTDGSPTQYYQTLYHL